MALDSATKRRSMLAMGVLAIVIHPVPDASIDSIDKKHFMGLMAALATAAPGVVVLLGKLYSVIMHTSQLYATSLADAEFRAEVLAEGDFGANVR